MPAQGHKLLHRADVKHLDELVPRRRRDHVPVRGPRERLNRILVAVPVWRAKSAPPFFFGAGGFGGTHRVVRTLPVLGSQNLTRLSLDPEASKPFVGCHLTHLTSQPWPAGIKVESQPRGGRENIRGRKTTQPVRTLSSFMRSKFQILMTPSSAPVTNLSSLGAQLASRIDSLWP